MKKSGKSVGQDVCEPCSEVNSFLSQIRIIPIVVLVFNSIRSPIAGFSFDIQFYTKYAALETVCAILGRDL